MRTGQQHSKVLRIFLVLLFLSEIPLTAFCNFPYPGLNLKHYSTADGLSNNYINCIIQDHLGFIWLGTNDGLNRFDGVEFVVYRKKSGDTTSLVSNNITYLAEDSSKRIWIATDHGLCYFDLVNSRVHRCPIPVLSNTPIFSLLVSDSNSIWIGTKEHVFHLSLTDFSIISIKLSNQQEHKNQPRARGLLSINSSTLLACGWDGIHSINTHTHEVEKILSTDYTILRIEKMDNDNIWVLTWGEGAFLFNPENKTITRRLHFKRFGKAMNSYTIVSDVKQDHLSNGESFFWITGNKGIAIANATTFESEIIYDFYTGSKTMEVGVLTNRILKDASDNIWVISENGFCKIAKRKQVFYSYSIAKNSFDPVYIRSVHSDPDNDTCYWLALYGGGLIHYDVVSQKALNRYLPVVDPDSRFENYVVSSALDYDNGLWIMTLNNRFHYFNFKTKTFSHSNDPWERAPGLMNNRIALDNVGEVWLVAEPESCFIYQRSNGNSKVVEVLGENNIPVTVMRLPKLVRDRQENIWLASLEGIFKYDEARKNFRNTQIGLPDFISDILCDASGNLWALSGSRLFKCNPVTRSVNEYSSADGLFSEDAVNLGEIPNKKLMYVGYDGKFLLFDPNELQLTENLQPIRLTGFQILSSESTLMNSPFQNLVSLEYFDNDIRFDFRLLDFAGDEVTQYAFRLKGLDDNWKNGGKSNSAIYSNLSNGRYQFWVKAKNYTGIWSQPYKLAEFVIKPPYWRTWWFILISILFVLGMLYALYRYRLSSILKLQNVRNTIARDLHDDIGASLSSIRMYSDSIRQQVKDKIPSADAVLRKISENSIEMVGNMSDIVWAINPKNDSLRNMIERMQSFAIEVCTPNNITPQFNFEEGVNPKIAMELRKTIFLIFKEAVNNAVKYSQCRFLRICLKIENHLLEITINDDGCGFDMDEIRSGNGLFNMQERAREIKSDLKIHSRREVGTSISLKVHIPGFGDM